MNTSKYNLLKAFEEKAKQVERYRLFAYKAERDNAHQAERLFKAAAEAGSVTAVNHLMAIYYPAKSTKENLKEAITVESYETENLFPEMLDTAKSENNRLAEWSFAYGIVVEKIHSQLYKKMLENFGELQRENFPYFVCPRCANIMEREAPKNCPVCGLGSSKFKKIE